MAALKRGWKLAVSALLVVAGLATASIVLIAAQQPAAAVAATSDTTTTEPPQPDRAQVLELAAGLEAARAGDWDAVRTVRVSSSDPLVKRILLWRLASDASSTAIFGEIQEGLHQLEGWPRRGAMRRKAEQAILDSSLNATDRAAFLREEDGPLTGDGKAALALALLELGQSSEALALARDAYINHPLTPRAEGELLRAFGKSFTTSDFANRAHAALWRDDVAGALRLSPRLSGPERKIVDARIALQRGGARGLQAAVNAANAVRPNDTGLLYDRARYIRRAGRPEDALQVIVRTDPSQAPASAQQALNVERRLFVNRALRAGAYDSAYRLAAEHNLGRSVELADTEWLAGFVAFRFLRDLDKAKLHWQKLRENVSAPVSVTRAAYWLGRVAEKQGDTAGAQSLFAEAAAYGFTYYGQLALERLGETRLSFISDAQPPTAEQRKAFEERELIRALRLIAAAGQRDDFESLSFGLDDMLETPAEHEQLSDIALAQGYYKTALRSAKAGLRRGVVAGASAYPVLDLPRGAMGAGRAEPALVHAIVRQESEFDPQARSGANARGLMQVLNSVGASVSKRIGEPYAGPSSLYDRATNLTVGSVYINQLIEQFDGSYILALAAYNAGPSRANEWIGFWGDPRSPGVDPVEWVELIPFEETRNYVQRVMENLEVYRHRLAGAPAPLRLSEDLRRGGSS